MRFLVRLVSEVSPRERFLSSVRALGRSVGADARNPKWTSYGALEIDIFARTKGDFDLFLAAVSPIYRVEFSRDLNVAPSHQSDGDLVAEARRYFNSERYWECHETLEGLWRQKSGEEKTFLQGIILLCAAFIHHQKGEESVALGVLARALPKLGFSSPSYHDIDVNAMAAKASAMGKSGELSPFPI